MFQRGVFAGGGPGIRRTLGAELLCETTGQLRGGVVGVVAGRAHHGQQGQLGARAAQDFFVEAPEHTCRALEDLAHGLRRDVAHQPRGQARGAWPVAFHRQARFRPGVFGLELAGLIKRAGQERAAVVSVALRKPGGTRRVGHVLPCLVLHQHLVAADLAVVVHAVGGDVAAEVGPVAAPAEFQQPIVAQAVFHVGAAPARVEGVELALLRFTQAVAELPVVDPHSQRVVGTCLAQRHQPRLVALAQRLARFIDGVGGRDRRGPRGQREHERDKGDNEAMRLERHRPNLAAMAHRRTRRLPWPVEDAAFAPPARGPAQCAPVPPRRMP